MLTLLPCLVLAAVPSGQDGRREDLFERYLRFHSAVVGGTVEPRWLDGSDRFLYVERTPGVAREHVVDPAARERLPATDADRAVAGDGRPAYAPPVVLSPSRESRLVHRADDLWLAAGPGADLVALTDDGGGGVSWQAGELAWSPKERRVAAFRIDSGRVHQLPVVDYLEASETCDFVPYAKAGSPIPRVELFVFDVATRERVRADLGEAEGYRYQVGWSPDGTVLYALRVDRRCKVLELLACDPASGASRVLVREQRETFVCGLDFFIGMWRDTFRPLADGEHFLWLSERDGWRHVYLYAVDGRLVRRLTEGTFPVRRIVEVDEAAAVVYVAANADADRPYDTHVCRVGLDGAGFARLTETEGDHEAAFSPSKRFFLDSHSSVGRPPSVDLRAADGELVMNLARADVSALEDLAWSPPEEVTVKAADGETALRGVIYRPHDFDPGRRYPVIDFIYAGQFIIAVPNAFLDPYPVWLYAQAFAQLGYVTVILDGRGTPQRGKAFQDATFGRVGQIEIPDHVAAIRGMAETRPWMDLARVGIHGHSWGGYFALRGMLTAPGFYVAGVASAPGDLTEATVINEPYMDLPRRNREGYEAGSNPAAAANLEGALMLVHGTADVNAPFSTTMRMVKALVEAGRPHELVVLPGEAHGYRGASQEYYLRRVADFFARHLRPGE